MVNTAWMSGMADAQLRTSSAAYDHAHRSLMSRKSEKPWKPCPPKRSVSLQKTDFAKATTSENVKRTSPAAKYKGVASSAEPGPAIICVVPVNVSGRSYARLRHQPAEEDSPNGSLAGPVPARYSALIDASNYDLYGVQEHGFAVKQSLNLRGKNPSRDRWMARTGMNLDPYSFEDELHKASSRGFGPKLEKPFGKSKPNASFLLCSSRRSFRTSPREPAWPYQKTPSTGSLTSEIFQASVVLPTKRQRLTSEKASLEPVYDPRPTDFTRESDRKKKPRPNSTDLSQSRALPLSSGPVENHVLDTAFGNVSFISDHEPFFLSVAVPSGHSFWTTAKTRKSLPVAIPQLSDNDLMVATSTRHPKSLNGTAEAFTVMRLEDARRVPCSVKVISETGCDTVFGGVPASGRKDERSNKESRAGYQSQHFPSCMDIKEQDTTFVPDTLTVRHSLVNLDSQTKESFLSISEDKREAFDKVNHEACEAKHGGFDKVEQMMQRLSMASDFTSDCDRLDLLFPNPDGASIRSSTTSDWYSARDGHSESTCLDSLGSDPFSLDCASSKGSTTLLSRVKRAIVHGLGAVWTMFMPTSAKHPLSPASDSLSDVDSGCSIGTNVDLGMLQRSPSEISELQKLAVLADRIAADRSRNREYSAEENGNGSSPFRRRLARAFSSELETAGCGGSLVDTGSHSKSTEKQLLALTGCRQSSSDSFGMKAGKDGKTSFSSEAQYLTLPLSSNNSSTGFELPYPPLQENFNYFSTRRPFVSSLKVNRGCGETEIRTSSQAVDGNGIKFPEVAYMRNNLKECLRQFPTADELIGGEKLSCSDSLLLCEAPGSHFEISCKSEKQKAGAGFPSCKNKTSSDIKLSGKTLATMSLRESHTGPRNSAGNFTGMQLHEADFDGELKLAEECVNMNLPSSKTLAESLLRNSDKDRKSGALILMSQEQCLVSELGTQKSITPSSGQLAGKFSDSEHGTFSDEQLPLDQFSVSPELEQAIQMLAASSHRFDSGLKPEYSGSCITASTSKKASSKEKILNDVYISPDDLQKILEQSNSSSDISQKVETSLVTQTKKRQGQCLESSFYQSSESGKSEKYSVLTPRSCSLNDSGIQIVAGNHNENTPSSQKSSTAEKSVSLRKTGARVRYSDERFGSNRIMEMSSDKQNPAAVLPTLSQDLEDSNAKTRQMFEDFHVGGTKINNSTTEMGRALQMGSSHDTKSQNQSTGSLATKVAPNMRKAGFMLGKPTGTRTALSQAVRGSVDHQIGRKFGAMSASPIAQRTWASRVAFLSGQSS